MATFTNLFPSRGQTDVARTTIVSFAVVSGGTGVQINTLKATVDGYQAILNGGFVNGYRGSIFTGTGRYVVGIYPKSPNFIRGSAQINTYFEVLNASSAVDAYDSYFFTVGYPPEPPVPPTPTVESRACSKVKPIFPPTDLGLRLASDPGRGTEVTLEWRVAYPYNTNNVVYYNIYYSDDRDDVFEHLEFLAESSDITAKTVDVTIGGLTPDGANYFGVRAAEFSPITHTTTGLVQAGVDLYFYPSSATDGYVWATDIFIPGATDGFPTQGIILIDFEYIRYTSLQMTPPGFVVSATGRGYAQTLAACYSTGSTIQLDRGKEDNNTIIAQATPTFQKPNYSLTWVKSDGYGYDGYRDGYDGYDAGADGYYRYKQVVIDSITTDGTANDASGTFPRFDYCGSWRAKSPASFWKGQCVGSYFGGAQARDGYRVKTSVQTQMLQREEMLLETTGEPFALLRRMWTGIRCLCFMNRREHPDARCPLCYGTSFSQGYLQFFNPRKPDRRILVRLDMTEEDLTITDRGGLEPVYEPNAWTLPFPQLKDRDVLVRFNENNTEEFRYEVLNVTRNKAFFVQTGAQKFKMKRLPKSDIIYQYPVLRDTKPIPGSIITSTSSGPGLQAHAHYVVIRTGMDLGTLKVATLESQGHNHVIYNGTVQSVLGHTHTIS